MKTRFEWHQDQTDEVQRLVSDEDLSSSTKRPGLLTGLLLVTVILATMVAWVLERQNRDVESRVREDVILTFDLQQQAVASYDIELFSSLLSSRDRGWKLDQEALFIENHSVNRQNIALSERYEPLAQPSVSLSPDLRTAELTFTRPYSILEQTVANSEMDLALTLVYRLEDNRWILSEPDAGFWGPWQEVPGEFVTIVHPERDAMLAQVLVSEFDFAVGSYCAKIGAGRQYVAALCDGQLPLRIRLSEKVGTLPAISEEAPLPVSNFDVELPAPTLIGVPLNESDYAAYAQLWIQPVLQKIEAGLLAAAIYPEQGIYALCFEHPLQGRHVYRYDLRSRVWQPIMPEQSFDYLSVFPDDSAVLLAKDEELTLLNSSEKSETRTFHIARRQKLDPLAPSTILGWLDSRDGPHLLMRNDAKGGAPRYSALNLKSCIVDDCDMLDLPGFPIWSRTSDYALYLSGSSISEGSQNGGSGNVVGTGFSPFWTGGELFGFVRFAGEKSGGFTTQLVLGRPDDKALRTILDGHDLADTAGLDRAGSLFINAVVPNPSELERLIFSSSGIRDHSGQYFIFSADISDRLNLKLRLETIRKGAQIGVSNATSSGGRKPFLISANGRWLAMTELTGRTQDWTVVLHDMATGSTIELEAGVPAMPGNFALLDWSGEGQWLLVADREFLHLIEPVQGQEELIPHSFDVCTHIAWAD